MAKPGDLRLIPCLEVLGQVHFIYSGKGLQTLGCFRQKGKDFTLRIPDHSWPELSLKEIVHRNVVIVEREVLAQALKYTRGNKAKAARLLQIDYKTMHTKLKQFGASFTKSGGKHD